MTLNCNGKLVDLNEPKVMGILNLTPDSFYDGGKFNSNNSALQQVEKMLKDGATFIDVGAYSSRPNAAFISEEEELQRITSITETLCNTFPEIIISVDTFRSRVAKACIEHGASIINDISAGLQDDNMLQTVANLQVPYIMMHMKGTPQNMQNNTDYNDLIKDLTSYFSERIYKAKALGIKDIIVDVGFGFAKTVEQNFEILKKLEVFKTIPHPMLIGISRKSMIYKTLNTTPDQALNGTTALHMIALQKQSKILRVHDVKEAVECVKLYSQLNN